MEAWFLSDIHIKTMQERNSDILLRFLHSLREKNPAEIHLFLLGDIFDLWIGGHSVFVKKFQPLVDAIADLKMAGARITYIEGNHDVHIDAFWKKKLGIEVFVEAQYYNINGLVVRVEHGDLINLDDKAYLRYRGVIRHPLVEPLGHLIPGKVWEEVGNYASRKSRARSQVYRVANEDKLVQMIRRHAHRVFDEKPYDLIVSGHMHVFDDYKFQVGIRNAQSVNLGSWYGDQVKVLKLSGTQTEWVTLK
ncbi:UDP-2,3-diacylglucosamine diphosphatase [Bdellovibrio sp. HCB337]|uniref:UDP-2,3-diacylglucosamine diphosphatase n=1 Tax=Bdellovibrio sp. HCB337 TaxID=3394358 RepID=UPI0039A50570